MTDAERYAEMILDLEAKNRELRERNQRLGVLIKNLTAKIHAIEENKSFQGLFGLAHVHGFGYEGPNWNEELAQADEALAKVTSPCERKP